QGLPVLPDDLFLPRNQLVAEIGPVLLIHERLAVRRAIAFGKHDIAHAMIAHAPAGFGRSLWRRGLLAFARAVGLGLDGFRATLAGDLVDCSPTIHFPHVRFQSACCVAASLRTPPP